MDGDSMEEKTELFSTTYQTWRCLKIKRKGLRSQTKCDILYCSAKEHIIELINNLKNCCFVRKYDADQPFLDYKCPNLQPLVDLFRNSHDKMLHFKTHQRQERSSRHSKLETQIEKDEDKSIKLNLFSRKWSLFVLLLFLCR